MASSSRLALVCSVLFVSASAWALGVPPDEENSLILHSTLGSLGVSRAIPDVRPGEIFGITGDCVSRTKAAEDVRVVFALDDARGGYKAVLATDQRKDNNVLQVRVPDLAGVANQRVEVQLFVVGRDTPVMCNAGTIHIG